MYPYEKGHCVLLDANHYIVKEVGVDTVFLVHLSDPNGRKGKWVLQSLLPIPTAKINIE